MIFSGIEILISVIIKFCNNLAIFASFKAYGKEMFF